MTVTKKFIMIEMICLIVLAVSMLFGVTGYVFVIYHLVCCLLLAYDYIAAPKKDKFIILRDEGDKLYFKAQNIIAITVKNQSDDETTLFIKDDIPDLHFNVKEMPGHKIAPGGEWKFQYEIVPKKRGSYIFKDVYVKYTGKFGLCYKYFKVNLEREFKVYPNVRDIDKCRLILQKNKALTLGERRLNIRGAGSEFESLREYVEGDDYRNINWMATARSTRVMVNQYEAEKNQPVYILLDAGRPMSYLTKGYKRLDYAINAAVALADIVNQKGDNCGLMVFDSDVKAVVKPGKGSAHRSLMMETFYHIEDTKDTPDYDGAFMELNRRQSRRSIVFLFTNFETLAEAKSLAQSIKTLRKSHIPIIVLMRDDEIISLAKKDIGGLPISEAYKKGVALGFLDERDQIIKALRANGVFCLESPSDNFAIDAVNQYLAVKNKNML